MFNLQNISQATPRELLFEYTKEEAYSSERFDKELGWIPLMGKKHGWDKSFSVEEIKKYKKNYRKRSLRDHLR